MPQLYALAPVSFKSSDVSCDCLAHVYGNAADQPGRKRHYASDMTDAEWSVIRPLLPVPAWLEGRGGRPEGYCHRQILDAVRYVVDNGIKWRAVPADFPPWDRVYAFCAPCGASLYPRLTREELGGMFLGRLTYLEAKAEGDNSMSGKRWPSGGIQGGAPQDPLDMAKAGLLEAQSPAAKIETHRNDT